MSPNVEARRSCPNLHPRSLDSSRSSPSIVYLHSIHSGAMDSQSTVQEKQPLGELPAPTTSTRDQPAPPRRFALIRSLVLFTALSYLAVSYAGTAFGPRSNDLDAVSPLDTAGPVGSYWSGIVSKGSRFAVSSCSTAVSALKKDKHHKKHQKHGKDKHHKHSKHDHHHGHGHGHGHKAPLRFIPPGLAEKMFLEVPTNDSARA